MMSMRLTVPTTNRVRMLTSHLQNRFDPGFIVRRIHLPVIDSDQRSRTQETAVTYDLASFTVGDRRREEWYGA